MNETSKLIEIRRARGDFERLLVGKGIDVGAGIDPLFVPHGEVVSFDRKDGDAQDLSSIPDGTLDFVYSSHCLEDLKDIEAALSNWIRVLRPGGILYVVVPDWELYEHRSWPSRFNASHRHTFSLSVTREEVGRSNHWGLAEVSEILRRCGVSILRMELESYRYDPKLSESVDQTLGSAVCQICFVGRKGSSGRKGASSAKVVRHLEYGGGLGDIFNALYSSRDYSDLLLLKPDEYVEIVLITHNPHAREIFDCHPRASQLVIRNPGYWMPVDDAANRIKHKLPPPSPRPPLGRLPITFYPKESDLEALKILGRCPYVVVSPTAGLSERDIPETLVELIVKELLWYGLVPAFVGRNYDLFGRKERVPDITGVVNLVDKLTVPGVAEAVRNSAGVITCHSAVNLLAWHMRKPNLLLYPESVLKRHIENKDEHAFGIDYPECRHGLFTADVLAMMREVFRR